MNRLMSHCRGVNAGVPSYTVVAAAVSDEFLPPPSVPACDCDVHMPIDVIGLFLIVAGGYVHRS
jgi:hypothetical protein